MTGADAPRTPTVLLVDDSEAVRAATRDLLESANMRVAGEASDGAEAVELATRLSPDVVVMDLRMPRMGGIEATRLIRRSAPDTQVIVLTAPSFSAPHGAGPAFGWLMEELTILPGTSPIPGPPPADDWVDDW